jgi:inhibitor of KinA sporulation pathway (predicted exonuclease)
MRISNDNYLIVDVEATCSSDGRVPRQEMEIIEIGAVIQNSHTFEIVSEFQIFIKPVRHPDLTQFCIELTGITQEQVSNASSYAEAIDSMKEWMYEVNDAIFCSWGDYDRKQFLQDCGFHHVAYPFRSSHLNLKVEFSRTLGNKKKLGISEALQHIGLDFDGSHHRGLDDAKNIARIVRRVCTAM